MDNLRPSQYYREHVSEAGESHLSDKFTLFQYGIEIVQFLAKFSFVEAVKTKHTNNLGLSLHVEILVSFCLGS